MIKHILFLDLIYVYTYARVQSKDKSNDYVRYIKNVTLPLLKKCLKKQLQYDNNVISNALFPNLVMTPSINSSK